MCVAAGGSWEDIEDAEARVVATKPKPRDGLGLRLSVRAVLLPATVKLLGDWNWYLPKHLGWLPKPEGQKPGPETNSSPHSNPPAEKKRITR